MKKILATILLLFVMSLGLFGFADARSVRVKGYYKPSSGSYVAPYSRTSPNKSKLDNWSTKGNYNPNTGKKGTVDPFKSYKFRY